MLKKLVPFSTEQLEQIKQEGISHFASEEEWVNAMLIAFSGLISNRPAAYVNFSCFWWPIKKAMIDKGLLLSNSEVDQDLIEQATTGSISGDVAAAFAMQDYREGRGLSSNTMDLEGEDGELVEYSVIDEEIDERQRLKS